MLSKTKGVVAAVAVVVALAASPAADAATLLYPDLKVLPPRDLRFDRVDVTGSDSGATGVHNVLRFSNTVWNAGEGDLVVVGAVGAKGQSGPAVQRVYDDQGGYVERPSGSFAWHEAHSHYHYRGWGLYQLWKAADYDAWLADGEPPRVVQTTGAKTTSCILDDEFIGGVPGTRWPGRHGMDGCMPDSSGNISEGLAVGWGDTYAFWRHDQWIDLNQTALVDGDYVLRTVVNPEGQIWESPGGADPARDSTHANAAILRFRTQGGAIVDSDKPTGTVSLNDTGAPTVNADVTLKVLGRDDVSGVDSFRASNDGATWTEPIAYTGVQSTPHQLAWNLNDARFGGTGASGRKTVYVQLHDASGKWGTNQTASIQLDAPDGTTPYARAVRADNPVAHWRLDESVTTFGVQDAVGNNDGMFGGSPTLGVAGLLGSEPDHTAVAFDGGDFLYFWDTPQLDVTSAMTLEAWIKPDSLPPAGQRATVMNKPNAYSLELAGAQLEFAITPDSGSAGVLQAPANAVPAGRISHVVATFDGSTQRLYVNGEQVASRALSSPARINSSGLYAASWDDTRNFFHGTLDEAALYATAISPARIAAHFDVGKPPPQPPADPSNLTATASTPTQIDVAWKVNSLDQSSFQVQRTTTANDFANAVSIDVQENRSSYSDNNLDPNRQYWYRVRARNPVGPSGWSNVATGTTPAAAPAVTTSAATGVTPTAATLSGTVNPRGSTTTYRFEYGVAPSFGTSRPVPNASAGAGRTDVPASVSLSGLEPQTTYQYRIVATSAGGTTASTPAGTFSTAALPAPATFDATPASAMQIDLTWTDSSTDETGYEIQRSTSADFAGPTTVTRPAGATTYADSSGLLPNQAYFYRVRARRNTAASAWIGDSATTAHAAPGATTAAADPIADTSATVRGSVDPRGSATKYWFEYGTTIAYGQRKPLAGAELDTGSGRAAVVVQVALTGLAPSTAYHYRVVAQSSGGTTNGSDLSFTTQATPPPAAPATFHAAASSPTQVDLAWTDSATDETGYEIQRSTSADFAGPTTVTRPAGATTFTDTGLLPNQAYFYRVRARRNTASSAWATGSATTRHAAPAAATGVASGTGQTSATIAGSVNPNGSATTYRFEYGPTSAYGQTSPVVSAGAGRADVAASAALTGLDPATSYHYRIVAQSPGGTTNGAEASFTTQAAVGGGGQQTQPPAPAEPQTEPAPVPDPQTPSSDTRAPRASISIPTQTLRQVLRRGLSLKLKSDEPGTASLRVLATPSSLLRESARVRLVIGSRTQRLRTIGAVVAVVRLNTNARRVLARRHSVKLWIEVAVSDGAGNSSATSRIAVTLRAEPASRRR